MKLCAQIIMRAFSSRASDIHLEPMETHFRIRYRIDGVLREQEAPPRRLQGAIIQRFKLMANMKLSERRIPQDGRIQIKVGGRELDAVVETDPVFRQTMLVGDLVLSAHPVVTGPEPLRKVLSKMDDDDAEAIVVVDGPASRRRAVAVLDHNDIAAAYRAEIATSR